MRLATLHRPDGKTILVNPDNVMLLSEPAPPYPDGGNCVVMFVGGYQQPVSENLAAAAVIVEGPHGRS